MKRLFYGLVGVAALVSACTGCDSKNEKAPDPEYVVVGYVWEKDGLLPPADAVTAINYCFFAPDSTLTGIEVPCEERLLKVLALKKENPKLKVLFSFGGANGKGGYSEIAASDSLRKAFSKSCRELVDKYGADGIDMDWEFPGDQNGMPEDIDNFVLLLRDLREALADDQMLTIAAGFRAGGLKLPDIVQYLDYICIMSYDMGWEAPYHHTALRRSQLCKECTVEESLDYFLSQGVPYDKLVLGLAFYGRGEGNYFKHWTDYRDIKLQPGMEERWDSVACVPYIVDSLGTLIIGYENPRSLEIKCDYIKEKGMRGGMFWRIEHDTDSFELTRTVQRCLMEQ